MLLGLDVIAQNSLRAYFEGMQQLISPFRLAEMFSRVKEVIGHHLPSMLNEQPVVCAMLASRGLLSIL